MSVHCLPDAEWAVVAPLMPYSTKVVRIRACSLDVCRTAQMQAFK